MIQYAPDSKNKDADALSWLPYNDVVLQAQYELSTDDLSGTSFPLSYELIEVKNKTLSQNLGTAAYSMQVFHGGGNTHTLIYYCTQIEEPHLLQCKVIEW